MSKYAFEAGQTFERDHPFTWTEEGFGDQVIERWRPGAWNVVEDGPESAVAGANGMGKVRYEVVSVHTPPGYPTRVFYRRQFFTPEGEPYTSPKLRVSIARKFAKDAAEFGFPFVVEKL